MTTSHDLTGPGTRDRDGAPRGGTTAVRLPSGPVLVAAAYAVCVLGLVALLALSMLWTDDIWASQGPVEAMTGVGAIGTSALVLALLLTAAFRRSASATRVGAVVMGALSVLLLVFFWSGAPAVAGACAAWLGGLTRGSTRQTGAPRVFAIVGLFVLALNAVLNIGGPIIDGIQHL